MHNVILSLENFGKTLRKGHFVVLLWRAKACRTFRFWKSLSQSKNLRRPNVIIYVHHDVTFCDGIECIYVKETKKIVSEYDQEISQSQTADNPMVPGGRAAQSLRDSRKRN